MPDKVAVIGAGAVGGYYGGALARAGLDVALICRGAHRDKIVADGLYVESNWGSYTVHPQATPDSNEVGSVDLVLYAVKLYSNPEAIPLIKPLLGENTVVVPVQNGTESAAIIADVYGWDRVVAGTTYIEAGRKGLGHIEQAGATARIAFGEQDGSRTTRIDRIESILSQEGVQAEVSADIRKTLWSKLILVAAVGTMMAATRGNYVQILENPEGERTVRTVMKEIQTVGESEGVTFDDGLIENNLKGSRDEAHELMASLQIDLEAGNPLEIDNLLGAVIKKGREITIPVPASAALYSTLYNFRAGTPA